MMKRRVLVVFWVLFLTGGMLACPDALEKTSIKGNISEETTAGIATKSTELEDEVMAAFNALKDDIALCGSQGKTLGSDGAGAAVCQDIILIVNE